MTVTESPESTDGGSSGGSEDYHESPESSSSSDSGDSGTGGPDIEPMRQQASPTSPLRAEPGPRTHNQPLGGGGYQYPQQKGMARKQR